MMKAKKLLVALTLGSISFATVSCAETSGKKAVSEHEHNAEDASSADQSESAEGFSTDEWALGHKSERSLEIPELETRTFPANDNSRQSGVATPSYAGMRPYQGSSGDLPMALGYETLRFGEMYSTGIYAGDPGSGALYQGIDLPAPEDGFEEPDAGLGTILYEDSAVKVLIIRDWVKESQGIKKEETRRVIQKVNLVNGEVESQIDMPAELEEFFPFGGTDGKNIFFAKQKPMLDRRNNDEFALVDLRTLKVDDGEIVHSADQVRNYCPDLISNKRIGILPRKDGTRYYYCPDPDGSIAEYDMFSGEERIVANGTSSIDIYGARSGNVIVTYEGEGRKLTFVPMEGEIYSEEVGFNGPVNSVVGDVVTFYLEGGEPGKNGALVFDLSAREELFRLSDEDVKGLKLKRITADQEHLYTVSKAGEIVKHDLGTGDVLEENLRAYPAAGTHRTQWFAVPEGLSFQGEDGELDTQYVELWVDRNESA